MLGAGWCDDPRYATNPARVRAREAIVPLLASAMATWPKTALLAGLEKVGVPAGPINDLAEVFADPQVLHRRLVTRLPPDGTPALRSPIVIDGVPQVAGTPAPRLDADATLRSASGWPERD